MTELPEIKKLGFGMMRLPLLDESDPKSIDLDTVKQMVDTALEKGFTYFDTAFPYHLQCSETAVGKALVARHPRDSFLLADKMPPWEIKTRADYPRIFELQKKRCQVSYFDFYLLHSLGVQNDKIMEETGGYDFLLHLKKTGQARAVGFSFHDQPEVLDGILTRHPQVDFVQLQVNYADMERTTIRSRDCLNVAKQHGVPVIVMEPVKGGGLAAPGEKIASLFHAAAPNASPASWALRFAASQPGVYLVLSGMSSMAQMKENINTMEDFKPLSEKEEKVIQAVQQIIKESTAIPCTACRYCTDGCPQKIDIPKLFSLYNMVEQFGDQNYPMMHYSRAIAESGRARDCIACGQCEAHCPQHIPIIQMLQKVSQQFDG